MITIAEMKALEHQAVQQGISLQELMENAGKAVFDVINEKYELDNEKIVIFAGQGNNGGDGFVTARHFYKEGYQVIVIFFGDQWKLSEEAKVNYDKIKSKVTVIEVKEKEDLKQFRFQESLDFIFIDALLGMGIKDEIRDPINFAIDYFNSQKGLKVAVDLPSGMDGDTGEGEQVCQADLIVCFHDIKKGLEKFKDQTVIVDIGIPDSDVKISSAK
jgi:NAD(P)H-hydrate epimerase